MSLFVRRAAFVAVALVVGVFSALPHQHDDLVEGWQKQLVEQIGVCNTPAASHLHAARPVQAHPCAACLRQHSVVALRLVPLFAVRLRAVAIVGLAFTDPRNAVVVLTSSRGPPV